MEKADIASYYNDIYKLYKSIKPVTDKQPTIEIKKK